MTRAGTARLTLRTPRAAPWPPLEGPIPGEEGSSSLPASHGPEKASTAPRPPSASPWSLFGAAVALLVLALAGCAGGGPPPWPPVWPDAFKRQALFSCRTGEREACWHFVTGYSGGERR